MSIPDDWLLGPGDHEDEPPEPNDVHQLAAKLAAELDVTARHLAYLTARHDRVVAMARQLAARLRQTP